MLYKDIHLVVDSTQARMALPVALRLEKVRLVIPVATTETRSLKASLLRSVTGGRLNRSRGGAVVTALDEISSTASKSI